MALQDQKQQRHKRYYSHIRLFSIFLAILLIVIGTLFAIYTEGQWAKILSLILAGMGAVLTLLQIAFPSASKESIIPQTAAKEPIILPATSKEFKYFQDELKGSLGESNLGALVVYANKNLVGCLAYIYIQLPDQLAVYPQFRLQPLPTRAYENEYHDLQPVYIAEHQIYKHNLYAAVFHRLRPRTYHVALHSIPEFSLLNNTVIDVHPGQVAVLDWRDTHI